MAWLPDLASFTYCSRYTGSSVLAVGWLEKDHEYSKGKLPAAPFGRLHELCSARQQWRILMYRGFHTCSLCGKKGPHGSRNLFIPGSNVIYASPELIAHYIERHSYLPPAEFCEAVLECPDPGTPEYRKRFCENGGREYMTAVHGDESMLDWRL